MPKVLVLAGSTRRASFNRRLAAAAAEVSKEQGAVTTLLELADYPLPLFSQDLESEDGLPGHALELKNLFLAHDALIIACPEYNGSITPLLKNTIDWVSRRAGDEPSLAAYRGKTALLLSASPGALGGLRGLVHVRAILSGIGVLVLPEQIAVPRAFEAFTESGSLADDAHAEKVHRAVAELIRVTRRLAA